MLRQRLVCFPQPVRGFLPQLVPGELLEAQLVTAAHQTVPVRTFVRSGRPQGRVAQGPNGQGAERGSGRTGQPSLLPNGAKKVGPRSLSNDSKILSSIRIRLGLRADALLPGHENALHSKRAGLKLSGFARRMACRYCLAPQSLG